MSRSSSGLTAREAVVNARSSGAINTTTVVTTVKTIDGVPLDLFEELTLYLTANNALAGADPTVSVFVQRALVPDADPAEATHWEDLARFDTIVEATALERVMDFSRRRVVTPSTAAVELVVGAGHAIDRLTMAVTEQLAVPWGDQLRIVEVTANSTVSAPCVWSLYATGYRKRPPSG